ncbi:MAG TPA: recombinase family protein [Paracoccaceae bacterium]|nr:recombinase family protein [Paracoccaceae bacterium]
MTRAKPEPIRRLLCAIYTRKSSEEGLEQEFNSLHAQREACEAYIASQRAEGWACLRDLYDDGGFSGGTLDRVERGLLEMSAEQAVANYRHAIDKGYLYKLLHNRVYRGEAVHKGTSYPDEHEAIVDEDPWNAAHELLASNRQAHAGRARSTTPALLRGLIFTETGTAMTPHHTKRGTRRYCYYVSMDVIRSVPRPNCAGRSGCRGRWWKRR